MKIIDLFAGPGGLGEGFSAFRTDNGDSPFSIALSIEKDPSAQKTLALRSFYRQFSNEELPAEYFEFLSGSRGKLPEDDLFRIQRLRKQVLAAQEEARCLTLGEDNRAVNRAISEALGKKRQPWVLIGGPPCQAYSLAGRSRNKGIENYAFEADHRTYLYREYLKVLARFTPDVFVMENVKGMLSAKIGGESVFSRIKADLLCPARALKSRERRTTYEVFPFVGSQNSSGLLADEMSPTDFIIRSERYGIPQNRHRVILLGIRSDRVGRARIQPLKESVAPCIDHIIGDLPRLRSGLSKASDDLRSWQSAISIGADDVLSGVAAHGHEDVAGVMRAAINKIERSNLGRGQNWAVETPGAMSKQLSQELRDWYKGVDVTVPVTNHDTRAHIRMDLLRYLFCASFGVARAGKGRLSPNSDDFPRVLAPNHANWSTGSFADRFRVQSAGQTATTVTSHISKDGHYFIHYDPSQCRSLTVREAARVQTFPDSYFFVGTRTQQYVQVGNAVPPLLAKQLAATVCGIIAG